MWYFLAFFFALVAGTPLLLNSVLEPLLAGDSVSWPSAQIAVLYNVVLLGLPLKRIVFSHVNGKEASLKQAAYFVHILLSPLLF